MKSKPRNSACKSRLRAETNASAFIRVITYNSPTTRATTRSVSIRSDLPAKRSLSVTRCLGKVARLLCNDAPTRNPPSLPLRKHPRILVNYHRRIQPDALTRSCLHASSLSDYHPSSLPLFPARFVDATDRTKVAYRRDAVNINSDIAPRA